MNPTNDHDIAIIGPTVNQCYSATATEARAIADACDEAAEEQLRGRIDKEKLQGTCAPCGCACAPDVAPPEPTPGERAMEIRVKELEDERDELRATIEAMNEDVKWYASELAKVRRQRDASLVERDKNIAMRMNAIDQRADLHAGVLRLRESLEEVLKPLGTPLTREDSGALWRCLTAPEREQTPATGPCDCHSAPEREHPTPEPDPCNSRASLEAHDLRRENAKILPPGQSPPGILHT